MKILVLAGGESPEHDVSVLSGIAAARAFTELGHSVALVDPTRCGKVAFKRDFSAVRRNFVSAFTMQKHIPIAPELIKAITEADTVFPALHGGIGENGRLAALIECLNVRYSGSSPDSLALAMDKVRSKMIYERCGIFTPSYTVYTAKSEKKPIPPRFPCVVKPADGGSSIGVGFVSSPDSLDAAVSEALSVCDTVIMEETVIGRELSVSVLNDKPLAVTEIIPSGKHYDYESKYMHGGAREITPAPLSSEITKKALLVAIRAHKALGLKNFSRTDMILQRGTNILFALETNALPGLTETSILPEAARTQGISFRELCSKML